MSIDWITVSAQIVNFLVLVWLLKHFLYGPVTRAMAGREASIAARIEEAQATVDEAEREKQRYLEERRSLDAERDRLLDKARSEAEDLRRRLGEAVREEVEASRRRWKEELVADRDGVLDTLRHEIVERFAELARRALRDLADRDLEEEMARTFAERFRSLGDEPARRIASAAASNGGPLEVRSRFDLPAGARRRITEAVHERIGHDVELAYQASPEITGGIELRAGGEVVVWSLDAYLESFEHALRETLSGPADGSPEGDTS